MSKYYGDKIIECQKTPGSKCLVTYITQSHNTQCNNTQGDIIINSKIPYYYTKINKYSNYVR